MITDRKEDAIEIHDKTYECADVTTEPYLGYLQEMTEFYLVNDHEYESLKNIGEEVYVYNCTKSLARWLALRTIQSLLFSNKSSSFFVYVILLNYP